MSSATMQGWDVTQWETMLSPVPPLVTRTMAMTAAIGALCLAGRVINLTALLKMFFSSPEAAANQRAGLPAREPEWRWFHMFNWLMAITFTLTFYQTAVLRGREASRSTRLPVLMCFLSLAYLLGFFGVSLSFAHLDDTRAKTAKATPVTETSDEKTEDNVTAAAQPVEYEADEDNKSATEPALRPPPIKLKEVHAHIEHENWTLLVRLGLFSPLVLLIANYFRMDQKLAWWVSAATSCVDSVAHIYQAELGPGACVLAFVLGMIVYRFFMPSSTAFSKEEQIAQAGHRDDLKRGISYPPPFPNGWYKVADSEKLKKGDLKSVKACGLDLVVFRTDDDKAIPVVMDAHCPHMGAHMGYGGTIKGDCIQCPFHQWTFDANGQCTKIPYGDPKKTVPKQARTKTYRVFEFHSVILFWFDAEGREPHYYPPVVDKITNGDMVFRGSHNARDVRMHIQEFAENSADFQHFHPLHGQMRLPWTTIPVPGVHIRHSAGWTPDPDNPHLAYFTDKASLIVFGKHLPSTGMSATITFIGPASIVYFTFDIPGMGNIVMVQTHTPIKPMLLQTQFKWFADKHIPRLLVSYVVGNWVAQWENDLMVWEHKIFSRKPFLVKGDGPMMKLRKWYKQFYSESSKKAKVELVAGCPDLDW